MFLMVFVVMMFKMVDRALEPAKERPKLPPVKPPPGYVPVGTMRKAPSRVTEEEELCEKKPTLESKGREIAREAGVEFLRLEEGWQPKYATPLYWFKDARGNEIIARDLEELKGKLGVLHPEHHSPTVIMPRLPQEAYRDILFMEYIRDFAKLSREPIADEEVRLMWEAWREAEVKGK
jgi:hypothetical protein